MGLLVIRGLAAGVYVAGGCYALQTLPLADVTMIAAIRPVFISLLSYVFLKESCGLFEVINLLLVFAGITFVIQPPFIFQTSGLDVEYSTHMFYTALALIVTTAVSSILTVVLRYLRTMH